MVWFIEASDLFRISNFALRASIFPLVVPRRVTQSGVMLWLTNASGSCPQRPSQSLARWGTTTLSTLAILLLLGALPLSLRAGEPITPHHLAKIRSVVSAKISPDGATIAYLLAVPRQPGVDEDGPAFVELHVVNTQGDARPYVTGKVTVSHVEWTPDGQGISYLAKRHDDKHRSLYVIPLHGGESRRVLTMESDIADYAWSPDGNKVSFLASAPESKRRKERRDQGFTQEIYEEDLPRVRVWMTELDDDQAPSGEPRPLDLPGSASDIHWSPAGGQLAVVLAPTPTVDDSYMRRMVHIVDAAAGEVTARLEHAAKLGDVAWSPDGRHLVIISAEDIHDPREGRLFLWSAEGTLVRSLVRQYEGHVHAAAWKDAGTVAFIGLEGVGTPLREVSLEGARIEAKTQASGPVLNSLSLSKDGGVAAFVADTPSHPGEVFLLEAGRDDYRRLTDSNPWLKDITLAVQEEVHYKARDGRDIGGVLVRPLGEQPGVRYPLILAVHGGPEGVVSHGWVTSYSMPGQTGAAEGIAVLYPNYRGSIGRGVAFSKLGQADAAGPEFDDLVDAIDYLASTGLIDTNKVGITGGSYGGYASAWGATYYSERYAASVMFVGISDLTSKMGTTDLPDEMTLVHHRKLLWEDWDYFRDRSPIRYVEKARTPLLILHGKEDPRVHPSQSLELHRHLKTLGRTPVRLVLYPGEGHGNRRAASRLDYSLRQMRWMKHYLIGPGGEPPPYEVDYGLPPAEEEE